MNWNGIRIAYAPYHAQLSAPGDRRRFVFYANERKIVFDLADPSKRYDIVYLTYGADLGVWIEYKKCNPDVKIVFELIDSYLLEGASVLTAIRGVTRYLLGKESKLWIDYKIALRKIVSIADAVVCSTHGQKMDMLRFNKNIHISLDYFSNEIIHIKSSLESGKKLKLVWEGQAYTVKNLLLLNSVLYKLKDRVELFIITDPIIRFPFGIFDKKTDGILKRLKCEYHLLDWQSNNFSEIISNADLAIIPISSKHLMMWNKPENKLLLMWEIGIPTLTSETPAYKRVMDVAGLDLCCASSGEWMSKIEEYINSSMENRRKIVNMANDYLCKFHNKDIILKNWDGVFDSLHFTGGKL